MRRIALGDGVCDGNGDRDDSTTTAHARQTTPDEFKWNLAELFPTDAAWQAEKTRLAGDVCEGAGVHGHAGPVGDAAAAGARSASGAGQRR